MRSPGNRKVFLAGAAGTIGKRLVPLLLQRGWQVVGTTRSTDKAKALEAAGVESIVVDVFDAQAIERAVAHAQPAVVLHQLTDLPAGLDPAHLADGIARNARMRSEGTANLVAASLGARVPRMVAQSIAWAYAPQGRPLREQDPLDLEAGGTRAISVHGVIADPGPQLDTDKARAKLDWSADRRISNARH